MPLRQLLLNISILHLDDIETLHFFQYRALHALY
jgi:hypothetical protein